MLIKNVVLVESVAIMTYPRWSDYGCLVSGKKVVTYEDGKFIEREYITEMDVEEVEWVDLEFEFIDKLDEYKEFKLDERIKYSEENEHSCNAIKGDIVEVFKGRKWPIGTQFIVDHEYIYKDMYGRNRGWYWVDAQGRKVSKFNTKIVKKLSY